MPITNVILIKLSVKIKCSRKSATIKSVTNEIVKNLKWFTAKKHFLYVKYNTLKKNCFK